MDNAFTEHIDDPGRGFSDARVCEIIASVRCPVHLAHGDQTQGSLPTEADIATCRAAGMSLTTTYFPGLGHILSPWRPAEFANDLQTFLDRIASAL